MAGGVKPPSPMNNPATVLSDLTGPNSPASLVWSPPNPCMCTISGGRGGRWPGSHTR